MSVKENLPTQEETRKGINMSEIMYENEVVVQGVVVHKYSTPKVTILTLSTGRATGVVNYPKCVCFNEAKEAADKFKEHDHVTVYGNVQSSIRTADNERRYTTQSIYADRVEETPRIMENAFGIKTGDYEDPENLVKIAGEVLFVTVPSDNILRLIVRTEKNGRRSNVQAFYFTDKAKDLAEVINRGDNVCFVGTIQTSKKTRKDEETNEDRIVHYENVVIRSLRKFEV